MRKRKICIITGTRAEFGLLLPVMKTIQRAKSLELQVIVTGMHLLSEYGDTITEIERNNIPIAAQIPMIVSGNDKTSMTLSMGIGIISFTQSLNILKPDIVVVLGDRFEIFSAAIAASFSGHVVAHISGGDSLQAGYDEYIRHAITKISHIHFPSNKVSADRIIQMGEDPANVFITGSTALDTILNIPKPVGHKLYKKYCLNPNKKIALIILHPVSTDPSVARDQMIITLDSVLEFDLQMLVIYPNVDPGGMMIINVINQYKQRYPKRILVHKNIPFEDYLGLMSLASVMVGNSSSGIIESSSFHLPVVNIGDRQKGRLRSNNILDVPYDVEQIKTAIEIALYDKNFKNIIKKCENPYGDGQASKRIVKILQEIPLSPELLKKRICY